MRAKMRAFKATLESRKPLSKRDWQLHDELFAQFVRLKSSIEHSTRLIVPAHGRIQTKLRSFCLNSGKAIPAANELYRWTQNTSRIPYYREILTAFAKGHELDQQQLQALLWNLGNGTFWEEYPPHLKAFLLSIDPKAPLKLPSELRSDLIHSATGYLEESVPLIGTAQKAAALARGKYYDYRAFQQRLEAFQSKIPPPPTTDAAESVSDTGLYFTSHHDGYSVTDLTLYNPTSHDISIDLSEYSLVPQRADVQPLALVPDPRPRSTRDSSLLKDLEQLLYGDMLRLGIGFTPGLNDVADAYELITGRDFVSGRSLDWTDRMLSGIGLIAGSGAGYRWAERAIYAPTPYVAEFEREFARVADKPLQLAAAETRGATEAIEQARSIRSGIEASPTLERRLHQTDFRKTDFIVRENGDVIPAKAYRYIDSEAHYIAELERTGKVPANDNGTYLTFEKFESSEAAQSKLQLPNSPRNNARYRLEVETINLRDLEVPRGDFGRADYLEPITRDFPQFGEGGATQALTKQPFTVERVIDLKNDTVVFELPRR